MKLLKLSFLTALVLSTNTFASDSLSEALTNGNTSVKAKAYYFDIDEGNGTKKGDAISLGLRLDYVTNSFHEVKLGFGVQTSNSPWIDEGGKSVYTGSLYTPGAVLSQAYLDYTLGKTNFKLGRQYVHFPLLMSAEDLIKQSYQGLTFKNKDIENTVLYGGYINKFQHKFNQTAEIPKFNSLIGDYAYTIGLTNKSLDNTVFKFAYGTADESHDIFYTDIKYKNRIDTFSYGLATQYSQTDYKSITKKDASFYAFKAGVGINGLKAYVAYAEVLDGTAKWSLVGGGKAKLFTSAFLDAGEYAESEQYAIDLNYNFKELDFELGARYVEADYVNNNSSNWKSLYGTYKFKGSLKGLKTEIWYEEKDHYLDSKDYDELRVMFTYDF